jgi:hypothetical protein
MHNVERAVGFALFNYAGNVDLAGTCSPCQQPVLDINRQQFWLGRVVATNAVHES